jgi:N-carbamoylputrescine amidase
MKVTVVEMHDDRRRFARDWRRLEKHVKFRGSELVLLPEMPFHPWWCWKREFDPKVWKEAVDEHERWMKRLGDLGAPGVMGSRPVNVGEKRLNQGFLWSAGRGVRNVHVKSYLPNDEGYYEASWYQRGDRKFDAFRVFGATAGMMICSDIWAIQHARAYGKAGAHIVVVPHAAPKASMERWLAAGKVVALTSGAYCLASNRTGKGGGVKFGGTGGWVISPEGKVLARTSRVRPFVTVDIDIKAAEKAKGTYPRDALLPD